MKRITFQLEAQINELINVPMFDDTKCFMVCTISNDKLKNNYKGLHVSSYTSAAVPIKNHRAKFGDTGIYNCEFKLQTQSFSKGDVLSDKWFTISFLIKHGNNQELLGKVSLNLSEFVNDKKQRNLRFLLERSKTNTIVKLSLFIRHLSDDENIVYQTSKDSPTNQLFNEGPLGRSMTKSSLSSPTNRRNVPLPSASSSNGAIMDRVLSTKSSNKSIPPPSQKSIKSAKSTMLMSSINNVNSNQNSNIDNRIIHNDLQTQKIMNEACEAAINEASLLDELINKTYRFTWQLKSVKYEEYTPAECVRDIIEKNGNGWKKNEEGVDMVDVVENEFKESSQINRDEGLFSSNNVDKNIPNKMKYSDDTDIFAEFQNFQNSDNNNESDMNNSDSDSDDIFYSYYKESRRKNSKVKRFKPLTEAEVRDDLRSWHISAGK
jgi:hypothetical protein